jgi:hypothetical protein
MRFLGLILLAATGAFTGLVIVDNLSGGPETRCPCWTGRSPP